ncbi:MAG TPA: RNA polymerase sigma-70 factor [Bacteroidales bacterium]|nr:RNA polymerase sigma-70 factor [Bacteroidales bacterium]
MKDFVLYSDEKLMKEIKADNMFAFDALYEKYCKRVYKFGYSILKSSEEAENLMQDVFLNLWENRHKVEKDSSVKSYVFTITYNSAISIIRKKARESDFIEYLKSVQEINVDPVDMVLEYNELTNKLDEIINALPKRQKEVYLLHKVEALKYNEIAERLNISVNTIENHMCRALKTIREKLGNYSLIAILFVFLFV